MRDLAAVAVASAWSGFRDANERPTEASRGRHDYERLARNLATAPTPILVANHVELPAQGSSRVPAMNDVGLFGVPGAAYFQQNEAFLALIDVMPRR